MYNKTETHSCLKTIKIHCLIIKPYYDHNKDLKPIMMCTQKKSTKLHLVVMMIRDCKHLIELEHIHMEQMLLKYVKVKC